MTSMALRQLVHVVDRPSVVSALTQMTTKGDDWTTINPRHIFRALLRQCTYLPDSSARHYFRTYVVMRFRKYNPRPPVPSDLALRLQQTKVQKELLKKARKGLVFLKRANNGHRLHLEKVLAMTYGRRGRRRRELVQRLMQDTPPRQELLTKLDTSKPMRATESILGDKLQALIKSQRHFEVDSKSLGFGKSRNSQKLNRVRLKIPETNSWDRPMPLKRVQKMKEEWYAALLDKIQPPLPMEEWERLRGLATGMKWEGLVKCRKRTGISENEINDITHAAPPLPLGTRSLSDIASEIAVNSKREKSWGDLTNPHCVTPRFMRRMWASIFKQCPCMIWDGVEEKWTVQWGGQQMKNGRMNSQALLVDMSLFEGVDEHGKVVSTPEIRINSE